MENVAVGVRGSSGAMRFAPYTPAEAARLRDQWIAMFPESVAYMLRLRTAARGRMLEHVRR